MTIPTEVVTDILASVSQILNGLIPLIIILFGVSLSFYIASRLVDMFPKR